MIKQELLITDAEKKEAVPVTASVDEEAPRNKLKLDVGGRIFSTTMETLECRDRENRLATTMKSYQKTADPAIQPLFIDRDPTFFGHLLNYLREGERTILPDKRETLQQLSLEADYFGLHGLHRMIHAKLSVQPCVIWPNERDAASFKYIIAYLNCSQQPENLTLPDQPDELKDILRHTDALDMGRLRDILRAKLGYSPDRVAFDGSIRIKRECWDKGMVIAVSIGIAILAIIITRGILSVMK